MRNDALTDASGARITGDIELHLSPATWRAHGHSADPRYNGVALHVTLTAGRGGATSAGALANGRRAPLVVLATQQPQAAHEPPPPAWPCAGFSARPPTARRALLLAAGRARFEERVAALGMAMGQPPGSGTLPRWSTADSAIFVALAEGLGYGRDRDALRACGLRLASGEPPDALLGAAVRLGAVERSRLMGLFALLERWRASGPLTALLRALAAGSARAGATGAGQALTEALTVTERGAVSPGRARILAVNVALPAVVAWARGRPSAPSAMKLGALALAAAESLPGLQSNQITREMTHQLGLPRLPSGALAQQGAHHLWARHCREKRCDSCPCAGAPKAPAR